MYLERFTDANGDLFIKFPLINNLLNDRGWRANEETNETYVYTGIGKPITLMLNKDEALFRDFHPFSLKMGASVKDHVDFAQRYAYGVLVDVTKHSDTYKPLPGEVPWFGIGKITDPVVKPELLKAASKLVPPGFSPGMIHYEGPDNDIRKYEILHIATVPAGAFGPRFVTLAKCQGALTTCAPQLKAAASLTMPILLTDDGLMADVKKQTYKDRCGVCPLEAFSSLLLKSGTSTSNNMSLNANTSTPAPGTFQTSGTSTVSGPDGNTISTTTAPKTKPTIRIKKLNFSQSQDPNNGGGNSDPNREPQPPEEPQPVDEETNNADQMFRKSTYFKELQDLKNKYQQQSQQWAYKEKRNEIEKVIPKQLFTDQKGRFRQKDWENEVERAIKENVPLQFLQEYYATKQQLLEVPEIKRASSSSIGRIPDLKGASSYENDIERERAEKCLRLNGGY